MVTEVDPSADLGVNIAASPLPVATDHDFAYTVVVNNAGPSNGSNVVVTDTLPAGVTFVSASSDQGVTPTFSNGVVTLTIATLNSGATANSDHRGQPDRLDRVHLDGHRLGCRPGRGRSEPGQ